MSLDTDAWPDDITATVATLFWVRAGSIEVRPVRELDSNG